MSISGWGRAGVILQIIFCRPYLTSDHPYRTSCHQCGTSCHPYRTSEWCNSITVFVFCNPHRTSATQRPLKIERTQPQDPARGGPGSVATHSGSGFCGGFPLSVSIAPLGPEKSCKMYARGVSRHCRGLLGTPEDPPSRGLQSMRLLAYTQHLASPEYSFPHFGS